MAMEYEVGEIAKTLRFWAPCRYAHSVFNAAYSAQNIVGPQSTWYAADPKYNNTVFDLTVENGTDGYTISPTATVMGTQDSITREVLTYYSLQDYWDVSGCSLYHSNTGSSPSDSSISCLWNADKILFGRSVQTYVGTTKFRNLSQFTTGFRGYTWGNGIGGEIKMRYNSTHTTATSRSYPAMTEKYSAVNPRMTTPKYYSHGHVENYNSYLLATKGIENGLCDGAPLFTSTAKGIAKCELTVTSSDSAGAPVGNIEINIKEDPFDNSTVGNGNTLKYCDENGVEVDYLQNLTSSTGKFILYFKVNSGKRYYIKVSPQVLNGRFYAQLTDANIVVTTQ